MNRGNRCNATVRKRKYDIRASRTINTRGRRKRKTRENEAALRRVFFDVERTKMYVFCTFQ